MFRIEKVDHYSDELLAALQRLLPQLSPTATIDEAWLREVLADPAAQLYVARDEEGEIVGTFSLTLQKIPTGPKMWLEDVVVDERVRGKGLGEALVQEAIGIARRPGVKSLNLTSSPERVAANKLYQKMGFEKRETNVYRMKF